MLLPGALRLASYGPVETSRAIPQSTPGHLACHCQRQRPSMAMYRGRWCVSQRRSGLSWSGYWLAGSGATIST